MYGFRFFSVDKLSTSIHYNNTIITKNIFFVRDRIQFFKVRKQLCYN